MLASEIVAGLERENETLRAKVASLEALVAALGVEPADTEMIGRPLTRTHAAIMGLLKGRPEEAFTCRAVLQFLALREPRQSQNPKVVEAHVHYIRKRLGAGAIETLGGGRSTIPLSYRLGPMFRQT